MKIYTPTDESSAVPNIGLSINCSRGTNTIKDGDDICLTLDGYDVSISDSIVWKICAVSANGQSYDCKLGEGVNCSFVMKPEIFDCYFVRNSMEGDIEYHDGIHFNKKHRVSLDSAEVICEVYRHGKDTKSLLHFCEYPIDLDILPDIPTIKFLDVWTENDDEEWPLVDVLIESDKAGKGIVYIEQTHTGAMCFGDEVFEIESEYNYITELRGWDNLMYCWVANDYGQSKSNRVGVSRPTSITNTLQDDYNITINDRCLKIDSEVSVDIKVFDYTGKYITGGSAKSDYAVTLPKGIYIVKICDHTNNKNINKKISIK